MSPFDYWNKRSGFRRWKSKSEVESQVQPAAGCKSTPALPCVLPQSFRHCRTARFRNGEPPPAPKCTELRHWNEQRTARGADVNRVFSGAPVPRPRHSHAAKPPSPLRAVRFMQACGWRHLACMRTAVTGCWRGRARATMPTRPCTATLCQLCGAWCLQQCGLWARPAWRVGAWAPRRGAVPCHTPATQDCTNVRHCGAHRLCVAALRVGAPSPSAPSPARP